MSDCWHGLYREGWGSRLRPASYSHPAKAAYGLTVRIYEHAIEEGWIKPGDYVVDCFSGVGGFALEALRHGLNFVGVELEQRFVDMGQGCDCTGIGKEDWVRFQGRWDKMRYEGGRHWCPECLARAGAVTGEREFKPLPLPGTKWAAIVETRQVSLFDAAPSSSYVRNSGKMPCTGPHHYRGNIETWERQGMEGTAVIVQGDSRRLGEVLAQMPEGDLVAVISSPPFLAQSGGTSVTAKSGPLADASLLKRHSAGNQAAAGYGESDGQLAVLPEGDHAEALGAASTSPINFRMRCIINRHGGAQAACDAWLSGSLSGNPIVFSHGNIHVYGVWIRDWSRCFVQFTDKRIVVIRPIAQALEADAETGRAQCAISSPPWEGTNACEDPNYHEDRMTSGGPLHGDYGDTAGQLGQETGSTFWAASRLILEQVYQVLAPGGHAIFVCKRFVRNKQIVDFPLQWARLCEAVGFTWIHHHKAWLVENRGAQHTLEGGLEERQVKRMSFFRRLHSQKYPHLEILWEDVLCFVKEAK